VTLLAFAASRAAAPLLLSADRAAIDRYLLPPGAAECRWIQKQLLSTERRTVVFIATAAAIYSLGHGLRTFTVK